MPSPKKNKPVTFKFIDVGDSNPELKKQNESIARSHVMTEFRKAQRAEHGKKEHGKAILAPGRDQQRGSKSPRDEAFISSMSEYSRSLNELLDPSDAPGIVWSLYLNQNISSIALSRSSFASSELNVLKTYDGRVSPHLHQLIDFGMFHSSPCRTCA
jgi:hypothetical protein